jgi:hypothetical protein
MEGLSTSSFAKTGANLIRQNPMILLPGLSACADCPARSRGRVPYEIRSYCVVRKKQALGVWLELWHTPPGLEHLTWGVKAGMTPYYAMQGTGILYFILLLLLLSSVENFLCFAVADNTTKHME